MKNTDWKRVTRQHPCPVCERPDWCLVTGQPDNPTAAICPRVESGHHIEGSGWLHRLRDDNWPGPGRSRRRVVVSSTPKPAKDRPDFEAMATQYESALTPGRFEWLADNLGLPAETLRRFRVGWSARAAAYSFPMSDSAEKVVGIRLRRPDGRKYAEVGTDGNGLFIPSDLGQPERLLILEGPTDTAAAVALGFAAVGRPSCSGGTDYLSALVRRLRPRSVAIVADDDKPGQDGAERLAAVLAMLASVCVIQPPHPCKDMRAWLAAGASLAEVERLIDAAPVRRVDITTKKIRRSRRRKGNR